MCSGGALSCVLARKIYIDVSRGMCIGRFVSLLWETALSC